MSKYYDSDKDDSESEDDTFVIFGTPLPTYAEDEVPVRKPVRLEEQVVKDAQGRVRFHGAFTGGFSAGYFNSVGTQEGWTPTAFVSSRSQRSDVKQRPEDFMDDEDFSEYGIAPRKLATKDKFSSSDSGREVKEAAKSSSDIGNYLSTLVSIKKLSIGVQLLHKMGWRENQGIGPRTRRKRKKKQPERNKKKVYGCALPPPEIVSSDVKVNDDSDGNADDDDDGDDDNDPEYMENVTFAPRDICPISFKVKDNFHGLGYQPLNPRAALGHVLTQEVPVGRDGSSVSAISGKKGIRGQAFGVGAFEEEDEDIYRVDSMSNYDTVLDDGANVADRFNWTAPKNRDKSNSKSTGSIDKPLRGFHQTSAALKPRKQYFTPHLPPGYQPYHRFVEDLVPGNERNVESSKTKDKDRKHTVFSRASEYGETPNISSVFELISSEDRCRIEAAKMSAETQKLAEQKSSESLIKTTSSSSQATTVSHSSTSDLSSRFVRSEGSSLGANTVTGHQDVSPSVSTVTSVTPVAEPPTTSPAVSEQQRVESDPGLNAGMLHNRFTSASSDEVKASITTSGGFKPFAKDPDKQKRYENFLELSNQKKPIVAEDVSDYQGMTEWEREREREEFTRAARLYRPLSSVMTSRFTPALYDDADTVTSYSALNQVEKLSQEKAAEMKMFGRLTREVLEWHPDNLVCKRFNIENPYPGSTIVGLLSSKQHRSSSVFDLVSFPDHSSADQQRKHNNESSETSSTSLQSIAKNSTKKPKPLAILSKVDLRPTRQPGNVPFVSLGSQAATSSSLSASTEHESTNPNTSSSYSTSNPEMSSYASTTQQERPTMDLLKSIFDNSDSEGSEDDVKVTTAQPITNEGTEKVKSAQVKSADRSLPYSATNLPSDIEGLHTDHDMSDGTTQRIESASEEEGEEDAGCLGPALPSLPTTSNQLAADERGDDKRLDKDRTYVEKKLRSERHSRHKSKKAKSKKKKKKHKHRSKKSKKSRIEVISSSSGSDADSESEDDDDQKTSADIDQQLLAKLNNLDRDRMKAADFFRWQNVKRE